MSTRASSTRPPLARATPYAIDRRSLGWLIVGASAIADQFGVEAIRNQPPLPGSDSVDSWIVGIHSNQTSRAQQFALRHHIPHASDDLEALLHRETVNCVYVANHPRRHFETVRSALLAGKHVLCEPPLTLTMEEAQSLRAFAESSGLTLAVNFTHRVDPLLALVKQQIAAGEIGDVLGGVLSNTQFLEIRQRTWRLQAEVGGVLWHRTLFDIDLLHFLLEDSIQSIECREGLQIFTDTLDESAHSLVQMTHSPAIIALHDSFVIPHAPTWLQLFGTNGSLMIDKCLNFDQPTNVQIIQHDQYRNLANPIQSIDKSTLHQRMISRVCHAVRQRDSVPVSVEHFTAALSILEELRAKLVSKNRTDHR